ncbi:hypothetical protein [Arenicella xantha]|uniref:Uncharacterized protein n=1 Tax=Arenicella xantha TaxID=644221 RepID=A0A395JHM4_9GAMM|nr:hypothetical protein [Arenicella xantha]RBP49586.1 hypothetical protein DFR28_10311 [Arenicella xantha]
MNKLLFLISLIIPAVSGAEVIVPEVVLYKWGYESIGTDEKSQSIKRIKGERWSADEVYYPRFTLSKSCHSSEAEALLKQESIIDNLKNDPFKGTKSHYDSFVCSACLYSITTTARVTYLEHQPGILLKYEAYIKKGAKP